MLQIFVLFILTILITAKFPNEIVETPIVICEPDRIVIKIKTTASNPSHIYAEDYRENSGCIARNMNKIAIRHGECGMISERMLNPDGTMYRMCVTVQIHPLFVTEADRSYCAQCVYMDSNIVENLQQNIAISDVPPAELEPQFDDTSNPKCSYSIRKGTVDGPEIHFATIGESVFHVWQCKNEHVGILVQNCHVEDLEGNKILIIDQNGCGIDQYVLNTPHYSNDFRTAFQPPQNCPNTKEQKNGIVVHDLPVPPPAKLISGFENINRGPPSITPPQKFVSTDSISKKSLDAAVTGSEFNGYSGYRGKRAIKIFGNGTGLLKRNRRVSPTFFESDSLPEMDVVGVIRVLDSPEDVEYYENRLSNNNLTNFHVLSHKKCMSTNLYWSLIVTLIALITIQLVSLTIFALDRFVLDQSVSSKLRLSA